MLPAGGLAQALQLIGNGNSPLYNPQLGGGFYAPGATTTVAARSLTVRFGGYALFQNTGLPGISSGVVLGGIAQPVMPALTVRGFNGTASPAFALFGTINGIDGAAAALLGPSVIDVDPALLANSRINGCLAGSGAGCLTTIVIQPTLQVFDWNSENVFGIISDRQHPVPADRGEQRRQAPVRSAAASAHGGGPVTVPVTVRVPVLPCLLGALASLLSACTAATPPRAARHVQSRSQRRG